MLTDHLDESEAGLPAEGLGTLAAQLTLQAVNDVLERIATARKKGISDEELVKAMQKQLTDYDLHTQRRLLQFADGVQIADDFGPDQVESTTEIKANTTEVKFKTGIPNGLGHYSLVRYMGKDWLVTACTEQQVELKILS